MNYFFSVFLITKRTFFILSIVILSNLTFAQNPTVINDSLVVNNRVYAKEKLIVDQQAKFKEDIVVQGDSRMKSDLRVDSTIRVDGNARFLSNVKMEGLGVANLTDSSEILIILPNGQLKKGNIAGILTETLPPVGLDYCSAENGVPKWWPGVKKLFTACPETNVGIATTNPLHKLHVAGVSYAIRFLSGNAGATNDALFNGYAANNSQTLLSLGVKIGSSSEETRFVITNSGNIKATNYGNQPSLVINNGTGHAIVVYANNNNKILQLEDNGLLRSRRIKVDEDTWADYVFKPGYHLMSLKETEKYILENGHLPNVPSENVIKKDGLDLGEMQKIQMEKIEELFLHVIELEKKVDELKSENEELKSKIKNN